MSGEVIPMAIDDESGERWAVEGHVSPEMAVLAIVVMHTCEHLLDVADLTGVTDGLEQREWLELLLTAQRHGWLYADERDREGLFPCDETHPDAMAYTLVEL